MEISKCPPTDIVVKEGMERFRKDLGDLKALADSFKKTGQILPIIINRKMELIDGGRRLAACIMAQIPVEYVFKDVVDPFEMRMLEIEANLHRKDYSPAEHALAVEELHKMKVQKFGVAHKGQSVGHSIKDTADLLGKSKGWVAAQFDIAAMVKQFPQLKEAKKSAEIVKAGKALQKVLSTVGQLTAYEAKMKNQEDAYIIEEADALQHMKLQPDSSIDILLTDPLYGIEAHKLAIGIGGKTGGLTVCGYSIPDNTDLALAAYVALAHESFRFTTKDAHGYVFIAPEHDRTIMRIFTDAGWRCYIKPLIWIKRETGQCNVPAAWPSSCYEMLIYIRKDASRIVKQGMPDWIMCDPVAEGQKLHQFEKPIPLLLNLLERVALPGLKLYDPFMGSGSSIEAAAKLKLFAIGCDNDKQAYACAAKRMTTLKEEKK